jgi:hypothetical protein
MQSLDTTTSGSKYFGRKIGPHNLSFDILFSRIFFSRRQNKIKCQGEFYKGNISLKNGKNIHQFRLFKKTAKNHQIS